MQSYREGGQAEHAAVLPGTLLVLQPQAVECTHMSSSSTAVTQRFAPPTV